MANNEPKTIFISPLLTLSQFDELESMVPGKQLKYARLGEENKARVSYPPAYHDKIASKLHDWKIAWT